MPLDAADKYAESRSSLRSALVAARNRALAPSPHLCLSEWARANMRLSSESSAEPGKFKPWGIQAAILDLMSDPAYHTVAVMKSARIGYTLMATTAVGYFLEHDPTKVLFVLPTEDNVSDFTKDSVLPMFRDVEPLSAIVGRGAADDDKLNKFTSKGSVLHLRGAHSADTFRRITSRINVGDEIDADGWGSGVARGQGDKIRLLRKRGETYWNSKLILGSTPLIKGFSRIEYWFEIGTRHRYFVPCPHCTEASGGEPDGCCLGGGGDLRAA